MLKESRALKDELKKVDTAEALVYVEKELSERLVPLWLFAWSMLRGSALEQIVWCAPWATSQDRVDEGQRAIRELQQELVPPDLIDLVRPQRYAHPSSEDALSHFMFGPVPVQRIAHARECSIESDFILHRQRVHHSLRMAALNLR